MLSLIFLSATAPSAEPFLRMPDTHGDKVVFACEGDIWLGDVNTGVTKRLTRHPGVEAYPKFSPDGKSIVFTGAYDGFAEVYSMPLEGGPPKRLTFRCQVADPMAWSADGSRIVFRSFSYPKNYGLYAVPADGGPETKLPIEFAAHAAYDPKGDRIAFTRFNRWSTAWFHYVGGMSNQVWTGDLGTNKFAQITKLNGTNEFPAWEGANVYFANELEGRFTVYGVPSSGGAPKKIAGPYDFEVREINAGPGAIVYEKGRGIEMVDLASGKVKPLSFRLDSDLMHTRPYPAPADKHAAFMSLTPTGKRVLVESRGQIVSLPAGDGEARLWKATAGARLRKPAMSPDGNSIAYISDEAGEQQILVAKTDGSGPKQVTQGTKRQIVQLVWSPDSSRIAYCDSNWKVRVLELASGKDIEVHHIGDSGWNGTALSFSPDSKYLAYACSEGITDFHQLAVRNLETGEEKRLGAGFTDDLAPHFSKDGRFLLFLSRRNFSASDDALLNQLNLAPMFVPCMYLLQKDVENPLKLKDLEEGKKDEPAKPGAPKPIEWDGIEDRLVVLPIAPGAYGQVGFSGSRVLLSGGGNITFYDLPSKQAGTVTTGGSFELSFDGQKLRVGDRVIDASGKDVPATAGKLNYGNLRLTIDPKAEWKQMFWDAWRLLRDYFYVANMHGLDWEMIGKKYSELLDGVRSRDELDHLIRWMQSELGSSHQYRQPGDDQSFARPDTSAFLGIDVAADPEAGRLKIAKIMRGDGVSPSERSPLLEAGFSVKEGDYLWSIAGQELTDKSNYLEYIAGRAGQTVSVTVASNANGSDKRSVLVKPISSELRMRMLDWVAANRRYVEKASGGKVGYLFLQAMGSNDVADFARQYFPQRNKHALIVDTRFNNGGYTQTIINNILERKLSGHFNQRSRPMPWTRQGDYFAGPMACLINEFAVSCGEEFPHRFKGLELGPLIGRRTYGGEVGSSPGWPLADGGVVSVPNYGMFTPDGQWVIEGPGVEPDIDVLSDPNAFAQGQDPQLDRAVQHLLDQIRKKPTTWPMPPADRVRIKRPPG
jgi:tricorn protease